MTDQLNNNELCEIFFSLKNNKSSLRLDLKVIPKTILKKVVNNDDNYLMM